MFLNLFKFDIDIFLDVDGVDFIPSDFFNLS